MKLRSLAGLTELDKDKTVHTRTRTRTRKSTQSRIECLTNLIYPTLEQYGFPWHTQQDQRESSPPM